MGNPENFSFTPREAFAESMYAKMNEKEMHLSSRLKVFHRVVVDPSEGRVPEIPEEVFPEGVDSRRGRFRSEDETFTLNTDASTSFEEFIASSPERITDFLTKIDEKMSQFAIEVSDFSEEDCFFALALEHNVLMAIHPFRDGNGRTLRIEMDYASRQLLGEPLVFPKSIEGNYTGPADEFFKLRREWNYKNLSNFSNLDLEKTDRRLEELLNMPWKEILSDPLNETIWEQAEVLKQLT